MGCNNSKADQAASPSTNAIIPTSFLKSEVAQTLLYYVDEKLRPGGTELNGVVRAVAPPAAQTDFRSPQQTAIVLDWDDTVFPRTILGEATGNGKFYVNKTLREQSNKSAEELAKVQEKIDEIDALGEKILEIACSVGHVILMTLCKRPWVDTSGKNFLPRVSKLLTSKSIGVIYANEAGFLEGKDENLLASDNKYRIQFFGLVKARALTKEFDNFYTPQEKWKNLISIGDSPIDRYGMVVAARHYVEKMKNAEDSHQHLFECMHQDELIKVRTKSFQMIQDPTEAQLITQLDLLCTWLPKMASMDGSFDLMISDVNDASIQAVEQRISGV